LHEMSGQPKSRHKPAPTRACAPYSSKKATEIAAGPSFKRLTALVDTGYFQIFHPCCRGNLRTNDQPSTHSPNLLLLAPLALSGGGCGSGAGAHLPGERRGGDGRLVLAGPGAASLVVRRQQPHGLGVPGAAAGERRERGSQQSIK